MCRNIRTLHNFDPPATNDEVHAAALQYVRKVSGTTKPSAANKAVFDRAVAEIAHITGHLLRGPGDHRARQGPGDRGRQGPRPGRGAVRQRRQLAPGVTAPTWAAPCGGTRAGHLDDRGPGHWRARPAKAAP